MGIKAVTVVDFATTMTIRKVSSVVSQKCAHEQISMFTKWGWVLFMHSYMKVLLALVARL